MLLAMIGGSARENLLGPLAEGRSVDVFAGRLRTIGCGIGCPARGPRSAWF
jgi:hypothetical protein